MQYGFGAPEQTGTNGAEQSGTKINGSTEPDLKVNALLQKTYWTVNEVALYSECIQDSLSERYIRNLGASGKMGATTDKAVNGQEQYLFLSELVIKEFNERKQRRNIRDSEVTELTGTIRKVPVASGIDRTPPEQEIEHEDVQALKEKIKELESNPGMDELKAEIDRLRKDLFDAKVNEAAHSQVSAMLREERTGLVDRVASLSEQTGELKTKLLALGDGSGRADQVSSTVVDDAGASDDPKPRTDETGETGQGWSRPDTVV